MITVWRVPKDTYDQTAEIARLQKLVVERGVAVQALTERNIELRASLAAAKEREQETGPVSADERETEK